MGFPAYGQRTPTIGLKVESDETRNFNWFKLDDMVSRAFTEGSPLQIPPDALVPLPEGSVDLAAIVPGATVYNEGTNVSLTYPLQCPLLVETVVARSNLFLVRGGNVLALGMVSLQINNLHASLLKNVNFTAQVYRQGQPQRQITFTAVLPPSAVYALPLALSWNLGRAEPALPDTTCHCTILKTDGADVDITVAATSAVFDAVELA